MIKSSSASIRYNTERWYTGLIWKIYLRSYEMVWTQIRFNGHLLYKLNWIKVLQYLKRIKQFRLSELWIKIMGTLYLAIRYCGPLWQSIGLYHKLVKTYIMWPWYHFPKFKNTGFLTDIVGLSNITHPLYTANNTNISNLSNGKSYGNCPLLLQLLNTGKGFYIKQFQYAPICIKLILFFLTRQCVLSANKTMKRTTTLRLAAFTNKISGFMALTN